MRRTPPPGGLACAGMRRVDLLGSECPIASALAVVGDPAMLLIVRDALDGFTRPREFAGSLGVGATAIARRLDAMVDAGILEPDGEGFALTAAGRDLRPVVQALYAWGDRHCDASAGRLALVDPTGMEVDPVMVDRFTGRELGEAVFAPGPAAGEITRAHFERVRGRR
jgi:DNA-binding HxlR family transcriptional regulator